MVIGSGIVGASAVYRLANKKIEVLLLEQQGNAKAAGAGIVCPWISRVEDKNWYEIEKNAEYYPELMS